MIRWLKRAAVGLLALCATLAGGALLTLNGAVALIGESRPFPLSIRNLDEKTHALRAFAEHLPQHLSFEPVHPDPRALVTDAARRHGVPESFALRVARVESNLLPHRISAAGAMGLMQLMPPTAGDMGVRDPFDSAQSVEGGVRYLGWLWRRYDGDPQRVAAAYNAGPGRVPVEGPVPELPAETRRYVVKVTGARLGLR